MPRELALIEETHKNVYISGCSRENRNEILRGGRSIFDASRQNFWFNCFCCRAA